MDYLYFILLALLLGFKHSYDADHLLAVSNFLRKAQNSKSALKISLSWAAGHMLTAALVTALLYFFRESLLETLLKHFEKIVAMMLILLGAWSLKDIRKHSHAHKHEGIEHEHKHFHKDEKHVHKHMLGIGIIHGLASNDELLILFTASLGLTTLAGILLGVAIFSVGVVAGMMVFAIVFSYPLLKTKGRIIYTAVTLTTAVVSVTYGTAMLLNLS